MIILHSLCTYLSRLSHVTLLFIFIQNAYIQIEVFINYEFFKIKEHNVIEFWAFEVVANSYPF